MSWSFQPVGGVWFTAVVVIVLLALVWVAPRPRPSGGKLWALRALRLSVVLLVLFALLRPTLVRTESRPLEATLLMLIDETRSMRVEDSLAGASRWQALRRMLSDSSGALRELGELGDVRAFRFAGGVLETQLEGGRVELPREADGQMTALGAALDDVLEQGGGERLLGLVLLSDGGQRALPPRDTAPQLAARRLAAENVPLYAVTFGRPGSGDRPDLAIEDVTANESTFVKAPTNVTGRLRVTGYSNRTFTVQLLWEDDEGEMQVVDAKAIEAGQLSAAYPFRLTHTPESPGERKLTVRVVGESGGPPEGELITTNNERSTFITVREGGVKVLYLTGAQRIGGTPGLEQRYVRPSLAASPDIVVTRQVFDYRQRRLGLALGAGPQGAPDVIVLDNLDASALSKDAWRGIAEAVRRGAGLAMLGGAHSFGPGGHRASAMANVLPIVIGPAENQRFDEPLRDDVHIEGPLYMRPTKPLGERHPMLQLAPTLSGSETVWEELPALDGANRFDANRLKANAVVIAETRDASPRPLLVVGQAGAGRVLASAVDSTFRWRLERDDSGEAHRRFWRQLVLWLARKDNTSQDPVWVKLDSRRVGRGGRLDVRVGVRGDVAAPDEALSYRATTTTPDGRTIELATGIGRETTTLVADTAVPGDYTVRVEGFARDKSLGVSEARFSVPDQDLELDNPAAEPSLMAQLAATTAAAGGRALAPEELPDLLAELAERRPEMEEEVLARITYWDTWPFFLLMVSLLGVEWYLRKRWGLV